jgi:hypothetical protein
MPEAAMHEDRAFAAAKDEIGPPWKFGEVEPIS